MAQTAEFDQLMADVSAGSEDAIWQLAETYTPYIIRTVRSSLSPQLRQKLDSQDLAQTLWASILLRRADLLRLESPEQFIAYLARAARNKVIDKTRHYRTQKQDVSREERITDHSPVCDRNRGDVPQLYSREPTPSTAASMRERWQQLLRGLSLRDQQILELRTKGCDFKVISEKLRIDESTARRAIQRVIAQFAG